MRVPELKAVSRECRLRGYSRLRKAELIVFLQDNEHQAQRPPRPPPQMSTWEPQREPQTEVRQPELVAPLTKHQLKHRRNKDSKLAKKFKSLNAEIDDLKSQMKVLEDKITRASKSTNASFKRKKIRSMKREVNKTAEKLAESEAALRVVEPRVPKDPISRSPLKLHPSNRNKRIEAKIADLNKRLRRVRQNNIRSALIAKRDKLKRELNWGFVQLQRVFSGVYRSYRIAGYPGIDPNTFFTRIQKMLVDLIQKETTREAVRMQATMWIKFRKGAETVNLAFNSRMLAAYRLNDKNELVNGLIAHMLEQVKNPALRDSGFAVDEVINTNIDFHRLNLMRGSSYLPLP